MPYTPLSRLAGILLLVTLLHVLPGFAAETGPTLGEVKVTGGGSDAVVEITADRPLTFSFQQMPELLRAIIDLPLADRGTVLPSITVNSGLIDRVTVDRKVINDLPLTRVTIHLNQPAEVTVAPREGGRLVASVRKTPAQPGRVAVAETGPAAPAPTPAISAPVLPPPIAKGTPSPPAPPARSTTTERRVSGVEVTEKGIFIAVDPAPNDYHAFTLRNPARLVIDLNNTATSLASSKLPYNRWGISGMRAGRYPGKVRLVFDRTVGPVPPYHIEPQAKGLLISFPTASPSRQ